MASTNRRAAAGMRRLLALTLLVALQALGIQVAAPFAAPSYDTATAATQSAYANLPLAFEPNLGQAGDGISYLVHHGQAVTAFSSTGTTTSIGGKQIAMTLRGAAAQDFAGTDELPSKTNYFLGNDQSDWHSDIPNYAKLFAKDVYPGIDLAYYGTNSQLEHDFIVSPGANYKQIAFGFTGQDDLTLDDDGKLVLKVGDDQLTLNAPVTYQTDTNSKHTIPSSFELHDGTVTVTVADTYDPAKPLVIDPVLSLAYSTYLGGSGSDTANAIAVDDDGNAYVAGITTSADFPTASPYQGSLVGQQAAFVVKFNPAGSALLYATYLGGGADTATWGNSIAADSSGSAYVAGSTEAADFPTVSPYQGSLIGFQNAFITKLDPSGSALVYSTYLGGSNSDAVSALAVDASGNAYATGYTVSSDFPTASPFQGSLDGTNADAFVAKLDPSGSALVYSTYLGGDSLDLGEGIAVDASGSAYIAGSTLSTDFPTASPFQGSSSVGGDAFVTKLNPAGSALVYSTYLGGNSGEEARGVAVDADGNAYLAGLTESTDFPTSSPYQGSSGGSQDAFVAKLNAAGSALVYSTYLGGSGGDGAYDIAVDATGNTYVTGGHGLARLSNHLAVPGCERWRHRCFRRGIESGRLGLGLFHLSRRERGR